jgi:hypothetical protein
MSILISADEANLLEGGDRFAGKVIVSSLMRSPLESGSE